jgi:apolipoprotein N-acyltransferase
MQGKLARLRPFAPDRLTILSGVLIVLAFPPYGFFPLIWVCLVPWFFALARAPRWPQALLQGVWLSFFMSLLGFHWVAFVLHEYGQVPWPLAILGFLLFSLGGQPQFLAAAPFLSYFLRKGGPGEKPAKALGVALLLALAYAGTDWLIPKLWVDTLGHALFRARNLRQIADLGGAHLITVLVYLVNDLVYRAWRSTRARSEPSLWPVLSATGAQAIATVLLVALAWGYGYVRGSAIRELQSHPRASFQAGVIQADIGDFDKVAAETGTVRGAADKVLNTFFSLSDAALSQTPKPEALIWPETSYPGTFRTPMEASELYRDQQVEHFVRERGVPLYFGGYDRSGKKDFNAFFFLAPKASPGLTGDGDLQVYRKSILLLFGEYIPGAESISFLREAFPQVGNFGRGPGPSVYALPTTSKQAPVVKAGPIICYEALFPNFVIGAARKGAELILNVTNDSWFGPYGEPQLHLSLTAFRSIETRLPQLRSTNTGISALIMPDGEITHATPIGKPQILNVAVPLVPSTWTLMVAWGDWFGPTSFVFGMLGLFLLARRRQA